MRERAAKHGRTVRFYVRLQVIVRETNEEVWVAAQRLISKLTDEDIQPRRPPFAKMDSVASGHYP